MATWIGIAVIGWVALSVAVSFVIGGMIRIADARRPAPSLSGLDGDPAPRHKPQPSLRRVS